MADFIYNATGGTLASNFAVKSDYLTPTVYPQHFCTSFYIELYGYDFDGRDVYYITTLKGDIISGNIDRDRSSEYIGSCSLEIALSDDCIFNCDENYTWENKIIKIIKTYDFLNDKNYSYKRPLADEPYFEDKDETDIKLSLGYYVVDSTSCKYDQSTRTLSLSGTDLLSIFGAEHGSTLIDYKNGKQDINGLVVPSVDENGAYLEVNSTVQTLLMNYSPIELIKDGVDGCYINVDDWWAKPQNEWTTIDPIPGDNDGQYIPYDLEFNEAVYLLDPLKKIKDLYEERIIYMSTEKIRFMMRRMPRSWADILYCNWVFGRQLTNLVMKEADSILATGGPGMVKAAYSSGKPALGVGAGNTPVIIDDTADVRLAVNSIIHSKTFDNGMICASEQSVTVLEGVYKAVKEEFKGKLKVEEKEGVYYLTKIK